MIVDMDLSCYPEFSYIGKNAMRLFKIKGKYRD
jgi:hypothetical protein